MNNDGLTGFDRRHLDPHRPQAGGGAEGVLSGEQSFDSGRSLRDGPKKQGAVGDRLVPGDPHLSLEAATGGGAQGEGHGERFGFSERRN